MDKKIFKLDYNLIGAVLIALLFFIGASSYNFLTQRDGLVKWNSPDETANYFFTKRYASGEELAKFEPANILASDLVLPRSLRSDNGWLKPVSFLGIILIYGQIAALTSIALIPYLTPFFGALGIIIFYLLMKRLFSKRIALMSSFLLAVFPVYLYYSVRSMFHNVLFVVLSLAGFYFLSLTLDKYCSYKVKPKIISWKIPANVLWGWLAVFLSGAFFGLAVITRSSELLWLMPVWGLVLLFYGWRLGLSRILLFLAGLSLGLLPAFYYNQILYQAPFFGGYGEMNRSIIDISAAGAELVQKTAQSQFATYQEIFDKIFKNIFFFGFHPGQSLEMFRYYVLDMFPWLAYLSAFGLLSLITLNWPKPKKKYIIYVIVWAVLSAILILYYGSWRFSDNPNVGNHTIGNSYTRYWLPIYLMAIPLACLTIELALKIFFYIFRKKNGYRLLISGGAAIIVAIIAINSLNFLMFGSEEGLIYLYYNMQADRAIGQKVYNNTPAEAIIMTQYHDKVLFPERRVIMGVISEEPYYKYLAKLLKHYPVYYFNFDLKPAALQYLNAGKMAKYGMKIDLVKNVDKQFSLYKLSEATTTMPVINVKTKQIKNVKK
jgi:hypothetical protein